MKIQLLLDTIADAEEVQVTDDEFGHEIVHRAQRAGVAPQQYYDQLVRSGAAGAVFGDVRRGKALAALMEKITIKDTDGQRDQPGRAARRRRGARARPRPRALSRVVRPPSGANAAYGGRTLVVRARRPTSCAESEHWPRPGLDCSANRLVSA